MVIVLVGAGASTWAWIQHDGNFHVVEQGVVYRSAQLSGPELRRALSDKGIRTVLNLRGPNVGKPWYDEEIRTLQTAGVGHIDVALSAYQELSFQQMQQLVDLVRRAPKPLLLHCESGADRSGLVSALYRASQGQALDLARQELSPRYGHFALLVPRSAAMDRNLARYVRERERMKEGGAFTPEAGGLPSGLREKPGTGVPAASMEEACALPAAKHESRFAARPSPAGASPRHLVGAAVCPVSGEPDARAHGRRVHAGGRGPVGGVSPGADAGTSRGFRHRANGQALRPGYTGLSMDMP